MVNTVPRISVRAAHEYTSPANVCGDFQMMRRVPLEESCHSALPYSNKISISRERLIKLNYMPDLIKKLTTKVIPSIESCRSIALLLK
jgi:hypothetical protein